MNNSSFLENIPPTQQNNSKLNLDEDQNKPNLIIGNLQVNKNASQNTLINISNPTGIILYFFFYFKQKVYSREKSKQ